IPNVLFDAVGLVVTCRELDISVARYLSYVVPRAALGVIPSLALPLWLRMGVGVQNLAGLIMAGSAMLVLFGLTWILFVYRHDPYVDVRPQLIRLRAWARA